MSIYVCSDVHGQFRMFSKMLDETGFSNNDTLYIAGDAIDRGKHGILLLKYIMAHDNIILLLGNHELMMYDHIRPELQWRMKGDRRQFYWMNFNNGGKQTKQDLLALPQREQDKILDYIAELPVQEELSVGNRKVLISHSFFKASEGTLHKNDISSDDAYDIVWYSPWRYDEYVPPDFYTLDGRFHVIGHVPVQAAYGKEFQAAYLAGNPTPLFVDESHQMVNVDYGCAYITDTVKPDVFSLCCLDLCKFAANSASGFLFIRGGRDRCAVH